MASRGVNKVILVGNLGADPETRYTPNNTAVTKLSLATSDSWRDRTSGEQQDRTEWHKVVMFGRQAEVAAEYLRKGAKVYIEGRLQTSKWQDNNGNDRYTTEVVAHEMQMLDGRASGGQGGGDDWGGSGSRGSQSGGPGGQQQATGDFDESDIPF